MWRLQHAHRVHRAPGRQAGEHLAGRGRDGQADGLRHRAALRPSQFTSTGLALGTAYYMAPEQLRGQEIDHRADQFALAVVLYELLTGEIPQGAIKPPHVSSGGACRRGCRRR